MGILIGSNFDLGASIALDSRSIRTQFSDLISVPNVYNGLEIFTSNDNKKYRYQNDAFIEIFAGMPQSDIFYWQTNKYAPYASKSAGRFDVGVINPSNTTRLNYDGYLYATKLYSGGTEISNYTLTKEAVEGVLTGSISSHSHTYEPALGVPVGNGYLLSSTISGVRSWISSPVSSQWTTDTYGITFANGVGIGSASSNLYKLYVNGNSYTIGTSVVTDSIVFSSNSFRLSQGIVGDEGGLYDTSSDLIIACYSAPDERFYYGHQALTISIYEGIEIKGYSSSWGIHGGLTTKGLNVIMGTSTDATWLIEGSSSSVRIGGIQLLDSGASMRFYVNSNYFEVNATGVNYNGSAIGGSIVYPSAGIPLSTGSAWEASIANNSSNWNTAYGWGNHASAGYITGISKAMVEGVLTGNITTHTHSYEPFLPPVGADDYILTSTVLGVRSWKALSAINNPSILIRTAYGNVSVGQDTPYVNGGAIGSGTMNVFIGRYAGNLSQDTAANTYVGYGAGRYSAGSGNIFIGQFAGESETGSNKLFIGIGGAGLSDANLITGDFVAKTLNVNGQLTSNSESISFTGTSYTTLVIDFINGRRSGKHMSISCRFVTTENELSVGTARYLKTISNYQNPGYLVYFSINILQLNEGAYGYIDTDGAIYVYFGIRGYSPYYYAFNVSWIGA